MKINNIQNISHTKTINFERRIPYIDMHVHDKPVEKIGKETNPQDILRFMQQEIEIDGDTFVPNRMIPTSLDCCFYDNGKPYSDEIKGNEDILSKFSNTQVDKFYAVCQPKTGSVKNIEKLLEKYPNQFVGLKFHPNCAELEADNSLYDAYLDLAEKKKLPCLFHSDRTVDTTYHWVENGIQKSSTVKKSNFSRPDQIYALAKRYPNVPIILGHFGGPEIQDIDATLNVIINSAKNNDAKLYADISWINIDDSTKKMDKIAYIIRKLKNSEQGDLTNRILFGTDAPIDRFYGKEANSNYSNFVKGIYKTIKTNFKDEADTIIDKIFYKNTDELFFQKKWAQITQKIPNAQTPQNETINNSVKTTTKKMSKTKIGILIATSLLAIGAIINYFNKNNKSKIKNIK